MTKWHATGGEQRRIWSASENQGTTRMRCGVGRKTLEFEFCFETKQMAFGKGLVITGGYWSCPAMQGGATVTTALTHHLPARTHPHS